MPFLQIPSLLKSITKEWIISRLLKKMGPPSWSLSAENAKNVDYYEIEFQEDGAHKYLLIGGEGGIYSVMEWCEGEDGVKYYNDNKNIALSDLEKFDLKIRYHYRFTRFEYSNYWWPALNVIVSRHKFVYLISNLAGRYYSKKFSKMPERMELLQSIFKFYYATPGKLLDLSFSANDLLKFRGSDWDKNPYRYTYLHNIHFLLNSFVSTGDLTVSGTQGNINLNYKLTGKSLEMLEKYQIAQTRHEDNKKINFTIMILTWVIAFFTFLSIVVGRIDAFIWNLFKQNWL
ncbi:MAG: hypothetical protein V7776_05090 [Halopseudomonas aestusnigri]